MLKWVPCRSYILMVRVFLSWSGLAIMGFWIKAFRPFTSNIIIYSVSPHLFFVPVLSLKFFVYSSILFICKCVRAISLYFYAFCNCFRVCTTCLLLIIVYFPLIAYHFLGNVRISQMRPASWYSSSIHCLSCQNTIYVLVQVLAHLLLIQLPANASGKSRRWLKYLDHWKPCGKSGWGYWPLNST